jgi:hypothetical protein
MYFAVERRKKEDWNNKNGGGHACLERIKRNSLR